MRKLDRHKIQAPAILVGPLAPGLKETEEAIKYFSAKTRVAGTSFTYSVYAHEQVKNAVSDLSDQKCAYCEANARAGMDGDVEHFRPKGEVTIENSTSLKPGYYWLAATWENLFLSCMHCNQSRKQPTLTGVKRTMGKKNQFPLSNNKKRLRTYKKAINLEEPYRLLIDPCIDDPLEHLDFDEQGIVYAKKNQDAVPSIKGETSIEVFALCRMLLVQARQKHAIMVMAALNSVKDYATDLQNNGDQFSAAYKAQRQAVLEKQIEGLKAYTREDQVFSAMSYVLIRKFLEELGIQYPKENP